MLEHPSQILTCYKCELLKGFGGKEGGVLLAPIDCVGEAEGANGYDTSMYHGSIISSLL